MLSQVSACLQRAELTTNVDKSKFCYSQARYLGYVVGGGCIRTDDAKIQSIQEFPHPSSAKQMRRFLGMTGWYRRFIQNYAQTAAPLHDCLKKDRIKKFELSEEAIKAFELLKTSMATDPVLVTPYFKKPFTIQCDASTTGVGGVLFQTIDEGGEHPIAMTGDLDMNNTLKPETAYTPHKLTPEQHCKLQQVIDTYPSCLEKGLGKTSVEQHIIEVTNEDLSIK